MNFCRVSQSSKISSVLAVTFVLTASYSVKAQETQWQTVQSTPEILSVPCFDGGGSGGWMYEGLPDEYFPFGLIAANEWSLRSVSNHPMYNPNAPRTKYATCIIVPARQPALEANTVQPTPAILSVPCFDGGGSGGWMYEGLPTEYFPLGLIAVNEWSLRSVSDHPMYNPNAPRNKYATCIVVPANQH